MDVKHYNAHVAEYQTRRRVTLHTAPLWSGLARRLTATRSGAWLLQGPDKFGPGGSKARPLRENSSGVMYSFEVECSLAPSMLTDRDGSALEQARSTPRRRPQRGGLAAGRRR